MCECNKIVTDILAKLSFRLIWKIRLNTQFRIKFKCEVKVILSL